MEIGRRKGASSGTESVAWTLPLNSRSPQWEAVFQAIRKSRSTQHHRLWTCRGFRVVLIAGSIAMEQRFRAYSSDSMGSDGVFVEESYYQGVLRAMDHRKGRVYSSSAAFLSFVFFCSCILWFENGSVCILALGLALMFRVLRKSPKVVSGCLNLQRVKSGASLLTDGPHPFLCHIFSFFIFTGERSCQTEEICFALMWNPNLRFCSTDKM